MSLGKHVHGLKFLIMITIIIIIIIIVKYYILTAVTADCWPGIHTRIYESNCKKILSGLFRFCHFYLPISVTRCFLLCLS